MIKYFARGVYHLHYIISQDNTTVVGKLAQETCLSLQFDW